MAHSAALVDESGSLYRRVTGHDYLEHGSIADELVRIVDGLPRVQRILDLGCGDAELMMRLSRRREIDQYFGVDRSRDALDAAGARLQDVAAGVQLFQEDVLDFLWGTSSEFDLILLGYALNGLELDEKRALLRLARTRLSADGVLLVYDVFRHPGESRQACLEGYTRIIEEDWRELDDSELEAVKTHIDRCCAPEDVDTFCGLAVRCGMRPDPEPTWTGQNPYHKLICVWPH